MAIQNVLDALDPVKLGLQLQSARKAAKKTQEEAANRIGVGRTTLIAIEQGKRLPSANELIGLAAFYQEDLNTLLRQQDFVGSLDVAFRARFERRLLEAVGESSAEHAVALLQRFAENYVEVERLLESPLPRRYPAPYSYQGIPVEVAADEIAQQERQRLNLGDGPVNNLREVLENEVGLRIFYLDLPSQIAGMFGYTDELGGCIAVNRKHPPDRQRMTLAHEYGHFLTKRTVAEVQITREYERTPEDERLADTFASRFLLPETGVRRQLRNHLQASKSFKVGDMLHLARYFGVSFTAFGLRLEEMDLIPRGTTERHLQGGLKVRSAQELVGLETEKLEPALPDRYRHLAVRAFVQDDLSEGQLMRFLGGVSRLEARQTVEQIMYQLSLNDRGEEVASEVPLDEAVTLRSR